MRSGGNPITGAGALVGLMHHIHTTKPKTRSARHHVAWAVGPTAVVLVGAIIYSGVHP